MKPDPVVVAVTAEPIVAELLMIMADEPDRCIMTDLSSEGGQPIDLSVDAHGLDLSIYPGDETTGHQRDLLVDAGFGLDAAGDGALVRHWDISDSGGPSAETVLNEAVSLALTLLNEVFYDDVEQISMGWDGYVLI